MRLCTLSPFILGKSEKVSTLSQIHYVYFETIYPFADIATDKWDGWLLQQNYAIIHKEIFIPSHFSVAVFVNGGTASTY